MSQRTFGPTCSPGARLRRLGAAVATVAVALIGACATTQPIPKYVAPTTGPTAKLVMRGSVAEGDLYGVFLYDDSEHCAGSRLAGTGTSTRNPVTTTVPANRIATVEFYLLKPNRMACRVRWSFTPVAGKTYLLNGSAMGPNACLARVMDVSNPDSLKVEATALRRNPGTSVCLPLAQSKAATTADAADTGSHDAVLRQGAGSDDLKGLIGQ